MVQTDFGWTFAPISAILNPRTSLSPWAMAPKAQGCKPWAFTLSALGYHLIIPAIILKAALPTVHLRRAQAARARKRAVLAKFLTLIPLRVTYALYATGRNTKVRSRQSDDKY